MEDLTGRQLGPYQIVAGLGEGGMAAVYRAYQPSMERWVAVKVLPRHFAADPAFVSRFRQEAKVVAQLQHPHILPVFDFGESDGYTYLVMPFVASGTLAQMLRGQPMPLPEIRRIITQIGEALDYAHSLGLAHRDIKPSNVLLDARLNCLLTDFGIAKIVEAPLKLTATGGLVGTPTYMSPEQGLGQKVDGRTDIYSLGVIMYEMATGREPYQAETPMAVVIKHIHDPLPPPRTLNPNLPEAVEAVILKALAKDPADRYQTAGEMVRAIRGAIAQETLVPGAPTVMPVPRSILPAAPGPQAAGPAAARPVTAPPPAEPSGTLLVDEASAEVAQAAQRPVIPMAPLATLKKRPVWLWAVGGLFVIAALLAGGGLAMLAGRLASTRATATPPASTSAPTKAATSAPTRAAAGVATATRAPPTRTAAPPAPTLPPTLPPLPGVETVPLRELAAGIPWRPLDPDRVPASYMLIFNVQEPPFDSVEIRRALALALDRELLARIAGEQGLLEARPATTVTHPDTLGRDLYPEVGVPFRPDLAREVLAAAFPDGRGFPAVRLFSNRGANDANVPILEAVAQMWRETLRIPVELVWADNFDAYMTTLRDSPPGVFRLGWVVEQNDPVEMLPLFTSGSESNFGHYDQPGFNSLVREAGSIEDPIARQRLYIDAEVVLCQADVAVIPLVHYYVAP